MTRRSTKRAAPRKTVDLEAPPRCEGATVLRSRIAGDYDAVYAGFVADLAKLKRLPK